MSSAVFFIGRKKSLRGLLNSNATRCGDMSASQLNYIRIDALCRCRSNNKDKAHEVHTLDELMEHANC